MATEATKWFRFEETYWHDGLSLKRSDGAMFLVRRDTTTRRSTFEEERQHNGLGLKRHAMVDEKKGKIARLNQ